MFISQKWKEGNSGLNWFHLFQFFCSLVGSMSGPVAGMITAYVATALPSFDDDPNPPFVMSEGQKSLFGERI